MEHTDKEYREARAKCPKCHTGEYSKCSWVGLFAGEKCPACGATLAERDGKMKLRARERVKRILG